MRRTRLRVLAVLGGIASLGACGTSAIGVDDCTTIEDAICERADQIGCAPLNDLPHSGDELSACIRFYSIACLHGLVTTTAPLKPQVTACVGAIHATESCGVIEEPQTAPDAACAWLIPPEAGADAGEDAPSDAPAADAPAADAATEADADDGG